MAWTDFPPVTHATDATLATSYQPWPWLFQLWAGTAERVKAATGAEHWPKTSFVWESGNLTAATATVLTDSTKAWTLPGAGLDNPWAGVDPVNYAPGSWAVVIDNCDPKLVIRVPIDTWTADTLTVSGLLAELAKRDKDTAWLVNKPYRIIRGDYGLWWAERTLQWPNAHVRAAGTVTAGVGEQITDDAQAWTADEWAGKDVLSYDSGGLRRATVIGNTATEIDHDGAWAAVVGQPFWVVDNGEFFEPGRKGDGAVWFYTGLMESFYGHMADDAIGSVSMPVLQQTFSTGSPPAVPCSPVTVTVFDIDYWTDVQEECSDPDKPFGPAINRTLRQIQATIEEVAPYFVPEADYDGAAAIPTFVPATLFHAAGINSQTATVTAATGTGLAFTATVPWTPIDVFWAIKDTDGAVIASGYSSYDGSEIAGDFDATDPDNPLASWFMGKEVVISLGWTRWVPREFRYFYSKTVFLPDLDDDTPGNPIDPPAEPVLPDTFGPGDWITRPASDHYLIHTGLGFRTEGAEARDAFTTGDLARYVGDNAADPSIYSNAAWFRVGDDAEGMRIYWDRFFTGSRGGAVQKAIEKSRSGFATGGTNTQLTNNSVDWWADFFTGTTIEHTGTASGGTTTTLVDATKAASAFWDTAGGNTGGRWIGFVVEVETSAGVWERRPITTHTGTTIGWATAMSSTASGKPYRIREPKELNRWKGRDLVLTKPDGTQVTVVITHSDDKTLYFADAGFAVEAGTPYRIKEPRPGSVWKWDGTKWTVPTGTDARVGHAFPKNQNAGMSTMVKRYGRRMVGDGLFLVNLLEIYTVLNLLRWTKVQPEWFSREDDGTAEENNLAAQGDTTIGQLADDKIKAEGRWDGTEFPAAVPTELAGPPWAFARLDKIKIDDAYSTSSKGYDNAFLNRRFGYMRATAPTFSTCPLSCAVDWFVYGWINSDDDPPGVQTDTPASIEEDLAFDPNGDDVLYHQWTLFESDAAAATADRDSEKFGNLDKPDWPANPPDPTDDFADPTRRTTGGGYYIGDQAAILKWDVAGGFTYVD